ncbi:NAD(P)-binding domain protein, partial [Metarhizium majus ARSEF 297]
METVKITEDEANDTDSLRALGTINTVLDITPSATPISTHTKSAIKSLRTGGRVSLMGSTKNISVAEIMTNSITLEGRMMYSRESVAKFVKILERRLFPRGRDFVETKAFALDDLEWALGVIAEHNGIGKYQKHPWPQDERTGMDKWHHQP